MSDKSVADQRRVERTQEKGEGRERRAELLRCAVQVASLVFEPCPGFEPLRQDAPAAERAYAAYLAYLSPTPAGDPVARFHLDNGARLERLNARGNMAAKGLKQSFGVMVNYLYDLDKIEASHEKFKQGEVARSRAVHTVM